jgi:hypothetical protein
MARSPAERLGLRLTEVDALAFDMAVVMAAEMAGNESANEAIRNSEKSAEVSTAYLLALIHKEG